MFTINVGRIPGAIGMALAAVLVPLAEAQQEVFVAQDGLLVVEFESGHAAGNWAEETQIGGYTGSSYLRWDGPNLFSQPGHDAFGFEFELAEGGRYHFRFRNRHDHPDSTEENDVWVRMDGGPWIKTFSWQRGVWTWATQHEFSHTHKPPAEYQLSAGRHVIEFSGRSTNFILDRFHLYKHGTPNALSPSHPESPRVPRNYAPVALIGADPQQIPASMAASTTIHLDARRSFDPEGQPIHTRWETRGASFLGGTTRDSAQAQVRIPSGVALPVRLVVEEAGGDHLRDVAHTYLDATSSAARIVSGGSVWYPVELQFEGPHTHEGATSPNPFLDYRLQVRMVAADGTEYEVPGFYAGNGMGGGTGNVWAARFTPDRPGVWSWSASFRAGPGVAVSLDPNAGSPTHFDGATGRFGVLPRDTVAPGFRAAGRLEYVGEHYLKQRDGGYWIKTGSNSPENFLAYDGFDDVVDLGGVGIIHRYERHQDDFRWGDPYWVSTAGVDSKGIIGALNYLSDVGLNSVYFLPMNLGGDGQDTFPFLSPNNTFQAKTHYDISRMWQWSQTFEHAQDRGILLHFVLAETEIGNETWFDNGQLGPERKLFFREMSARFGCALGLKWNLSEENDFSVALLRQMADYLQAVDPYGHAIAVHTHPNQIGLYDQLKGDPRFTAASVQYSTARADEFATAVANLSRNAGRKWLVDLDENGTWNVGLSDTNIDEMRRETLYDTLFSGGSIEWYAGYHALPLGGDVRLEDFRTRSRMWKQTRIAREFVLEHFDLERIVTNDALASNAAGNYGGPEVLAVPGETYAVYLPRLAQGCTLNLSGAQGTFRMRWFDPREGVFVGNPATIQGGSPRHLEPLSTLDAANDWIVLLQRTSN